MEELQEWRDNAEGMYRAALKACDPKKLVQDFFIDFDLSNYQNIYVIGFGKAAGEMALGAEAVLGSEITESLILSLKEYDGQVRVRAVPHPLPNNRTVELTKQMEDLVSSVSSNDLLVCMVSGGGSAMLCDPLLSLDSLNEYNVKLMNAGVGVLELNAFRRSVSRVKGGKLGAMCRGRIINLILSDVINGGLWDIASGPTVNDESGMAGINVVNKYGLPVSLLNAMDDSRPLVHCRSYVLADNGTAVNAAYEHGKELGLDIHIRNSSYTGSAESVGRMLLGEAQGHGGIYIAGGESTVVVKGEGIGGRNQHLCLSLHDEPCRCFSAGTDGIDGRSSAAGAFLDEGSRAPDWKGFLDNSDSASFFKRSNSQLRPGPTGTNVCDITIIEIE